MVKLRRPTPEEDAAITAAAESDPDARPLTDEEFAAAEWTPPKARRGQTGAMDRLEDDLRVALRKAPASLSRSDVAKLLLDLARERLN
jgi:hypothetical protein